MRRSVINEFSTTAQKYMVGKAIGNSEEGRKIYTSVNFYISKEWWNKQKEAALALDISTVEYMVYVTDLYTNSGNVTFNSKTLKENDIIQNLSKRVETLESDTEKERLADEIANLKKQVETLSTKLDFAASLLASKLK